MPLLSELVRGLSVEMRGADVAVSSLTEDSRKVKPGTLFAAFKGTASDGYNFIPKAVAQGASVILSDRDIATGATLLVAKNPREIFGQIAARFYAPLPEMIVAVTGTNGKTSTVHFVRQLWHLMGLSSASLGTIGLVENEVLTHDGAMTTPDTVTLYETLGALKKRGVNHVAMEASSHGLHQSRLAGVTLRAGAFTNLTRDHLDYHGTMEAYFAAKALLFRQVQRAAILNADITEFAALQRIVAERNLEVIDFGKNAAVLDVKEIKPTASGLTIALSNHLIALPLLGLFQAENILCAMGLVMGCGATLNEILPHLARLTPVPGRMEKVGEKKGAPVIVDYAHTPDALEKLLYAARPHAARNIILVFGCGGDRDTGKRKLMGAVAERLADRVIITDDNPRTEDAAAIRKEIMAGCPKADEIADRAQAIRAVIAQAEAGDVVVLAGKGHEAYQIIGTTKHPFSDKETALKCL